jgi:predicted phosphodiesterase
MPTPPYLAPMKLALFSDIHSNLEALQACLAHAGAQGVEQFAFLGDLVGYGADPLACLDIIETLVQRGAVVVKGNHDEAVISGSCERMSFAARDAIYWTRTQLGQKERDFLGNLPMFVKSGDTLYVHANADNPERWDYISGARDAGRSIKAAGTVFTFSGHVHHQVLYHAVNHEAPRVFYPTPGMPIPVFMNRQWLAIVGSVGQPRDGNNAAAYAMLDRKQNTLTFFRVPYDYMSAEKKILAAGLPHRLVLRLEGGH